MTSSSVQSVGDEPRSEKSLGHSEEDAIRMAQASIDGFTSSVARASRVPDDAHTDLEGLSTVLDLIGSLGPDAASIDSQEVAPPLKIGRYEVLGERGRGGFGIVLHAFDTLLEREVALKIPRPERLLAGQALDEMVREARVVAKLSHPGIVRVYEVRQLGPVWYIASDFCDGPTLAEWLESQKAPLAPRKAAELLADVAEAVHYAHLRGVLHLDLKPANILLVEREDGSRHPTVTDFGLAHGDANTSGSPRPIGGTMAYMAPEQKSQNAERISVATDVYALGVILSEMLGASPRADEKDSDAFSGREARPLAAAAIPQDLWAICDRCLANDPGSRYQAALDLAHDLRRYNEGLPVAARHLNPLQKAVYFCRRKPFATLAIAVLLAILFGSYATVVVAWREAEAHLAARRTSERERQVATSRMEGSLLNLAWLAQEAKLRVPHVDEETGVAVPGVREFFKDVRQWAELEKDSSESTAGLLAAINSLSLVDEIVVNDDEAFETTFRDGLSAWLALIHRDPEAERWHKALALHLFTYKLRQGDGQWLSWCTSTFDIDASTSQSVQRPYALLLIDYAAVRIRQRDGTAGYGMLMSALEILNDEEGLFSRNQHQRLHWLITAHQQAAAAASLMSQTELATSHFVALTRIVDSAPSPHDCDARSAASVASVLVNEWRRNGQAANDEGLELLQRAARYGQRADNAAPDNPVYASALSRQLRFIGSVYRKRNQGELCRKSLIEARNVLNRALAQSTNDRHLRLERARLSTLIGEEYLRIGKPLHARRSFELAVEDFEAACLAHTDTRGTWLVAGSMLQSLAQLYANEERFEESLGAYQRSVELMTTLQSFRKHHRAETLIKQGQQKISSLNDHRQTAQSL